MTYSDFTILIPLRIDSPERLQNFGHVLKVLSNYSGLQIIILEADCEQKFKRDSSIKQLFIEDKNPIFYRTKYLNLLCSMADTEFIGVWDADVIVPRTQLNDALDLLRKKEADMVFPFDGRCYSVDYHQISHFEIEEIIKQMKPIYGHSTCGGAFLANKQSYIEAGGENEKFLGWGPEDLERYKRWEIGGYRVKRTEGILYHLRHPIGDNSKHFSSENRINSMKALLETCRRKG